MRMFRTVNIQFLQCRLENNGVAEKGLVLHNKLAPLHRYLQQIPIKALNIRMSFSLQAKVYLIMLYMKGGTGPRLERPSESAQD